MYQAWPWGAPATVSPTSGYVQSAVPTQVATTQWPAGYSQYAVSPEIQQQWAAAWASQAQYAAYSNVAVGDSQATTYTGAYPEYQTAASTVTTTASEIKKPDDGNQTAEKPKTSAEQPISKELAESERIKLLEEQAEKWKSLQQPVTSWSLSTAATTSSIDNTTTVTAPIDSSNTTTNVTQSTVLTQGQLSKEEEEFERQFKDWEKQFETWKQQNQNHPDKEAFSQYEKQWQEWRVTLLQKKEQMQKAKAEQSELSQQSTSGSSVVNAPTNSVDTTAASTGMYYQQAQYMYMQPYMYPGAASVAPVGVPPALVPPTVIPPTMVPPTGVPPVSMQPQQQMPFNVPPGAHGTYGTQPHDMAGPAHDNMNYDNQRPQDFENDGGMYNYGPMQGNGPPGEEGMGPANFDPEGDFGRDDWKFGRGRGRGGRGRARGRGRGSRWSDPTDVERPGGVRPPRKTLLPGGPGSSFGDDDGPPPFEYPTEDCQDQFKQDSFPANRPQGDGFEFHDGPQQYPPEDAFPSQPFDENYPPEHNQYPPEDEFPDRYPPDRNRFPPDQDCFPPGHEGFPHGPNRFPHDDRFPPDQDCFPPDQDCFPPPGARFPPDNRFPENERFPRSRHMMDEGGYGDFNQFPPEDEMYGPPPFRDDFPPFDDRSPRGRGGRFNGRGRRFRGDFDRYGGPPFPPRMRNDSFGPQDFPPPDDRFGFPDDGPPPRGMRPQFGPKGRFPEEPPFYGDGPQRGFKTIDYTHRPAADVMGEEFNPHYEYEEDFQDDVNAYRVRPPKRKKKDAQRKSAVEKKHDKDSDKDQDKDLDQDKDHDQDKDKDNDNPIDKVKDA